MEVRLLGDRWMERCAGSAGGVGCAARKGGGEAGMGMWLVLLEVDRIE